MIKLHDYQQEVVDALRDMDGPIIMNLPCRASLSWSPMRYIAQEISENEVLQRLPKMNIPGKNLFNDFSGVPYNNHYWGLHAWTYWDRLRSLPFNRTILQVLCSNLDASFHWNHYAE